MNVYDLFHSGETKTKQIFIEKYTGTRLTLMKRIKDSIVYKLASSMIDIIVANGYPPDTTVKNKNITDIKSHLQQSTTEDDTSFGKNFYSLFFSSIPHMIESNVEQHSKLIFQRFYKLSDFTAEKSWPIPSTMINTTEPGRTRSTDNDIEEPPNMDRFQLCLPFTSENGSVTGLTIGEYFNALLAGKIPLNVLTKKVEVLGTSKQQSQTVQLPPTRSSSRSPTRTLRNNKTPNYAEQTDQPNNTNTNLNEGIDQVHEQDEESEHGDDDNSVKTKSTPKKQQSKNKNI
jgi:hypothetical protein